ncbi:MAG: DUF411 domain-containing protein [Pseudomonadales bacterium]|nr:DUF411 domain-containing protein [Pseudomonadales bacterium]
MGHLRSNGIEVSTRDVEDISAVTSRLKIPATLASCHVAVIDGYVFEGHIPADVIHRFLKEKPNARGLVVPGMPMGSPGMEGPRKDPYNVYIIDQNGRKTIYTRH